MASSAVAQNTFTRPAERLELVAEFPDSVWAGDPVPLRLVLANNGTATVDLELERGVGPRAQTVFDFRILDSHGTVVWKRIVFPPPDPRLDIVVVGVGEEARINPGGRLVWWAVWNQRDLKGNPVAPGTYTIIGILPRAPRNEMRSTPRDLVIRP
jgi:hypothetical protein